MARKSYRPPTNHTILVVDDQEEVLVSVRALLEREGHRVLTAESAEQALGLLRMHEVDLLLVDYFMPRVTGEELIRTVRAFDPYVQIILQTGYAGEKPASRMMAELDIQGYHDKSDGPDKLLLWVDVGLKAHRLITTLRERERLQGELVANVSHEFRTPIHIIGGYTELLLQGEFGDISEEARQPLQRVAAATHNLGELVADLLKYAKVEAGAAEPATLLISTDEVVAEQERLAALLLESKDVRFNVDIDAAPGTFVTDAVKLRTILRNLVTNAVKFTHHGTITLRVALAGTRIEFVVQDTGIGIPPQDLDIIFEPFRQLNGSLTREHRGIGLGLALSRKLARILGGDLVVDSTAGVGSTFSLTVPYAATAEAAAAAPDAPATAAPGPTGTTAGAA